jgi:copper chaperone
MSTATTYRVDGMTCDHCVRAVTDELTQLDGVTGVEVELVPDGVSSVRVNSDRELPLDDVRAAVDEAGYTVVR